MKTVLIKMDDELHRGLKVEAARMGTTMKSLIEIGLGQWLVGHRAPMVVHPEQMVDPDKCKPGAIIWPEG